MKNYTIRDIARMANVSVTTVSRVLNHRPDVKEETRIHVEEVMSSCNFIGNANARGLKQSNNEVIPVILRGRNNPFLTSITEALLRLTVNCETPYLPTFIDEKANEFEVGWQLCRERRVAGLLFVGSKLDERAQILANIDLPMVFTTVSAEGAPLKRCASVAIDDRKMGFAAVNELIQLGHRKIAIFGSGRFNVDSLAIRFEGAMDACRQAGIPFPDDYFVDTRFSFTGGWEAATRFFSNHPDVTAAFCMSDTVAAGVIRALKDMNLRVPEDVSVFGFDGIEMSNFTVPRLSTVEQPAQLLAEESVNAMESLLEGKESIGHILVDANVILRESVAPVRAE